MSKAPNPKEPEAVEGAAGSKKKKGGLLIIIGLVLVLLLGGGGAAAYFLLAGKKGEGAEKEAKPKKREEPIFVTLEPFVVNLAGDVQHYLQVGIDLRTADAKVGEDVKVHLPEVRNAVLLLLSSKRPEDVATLEQKNQLREEIRTAVNEPLGFEAPKKHGEGKKGEKEKVIEAEAGVLEVLLTSFVVQ